jgi:hypothetical protein
MCAIGRSLQDEIAMNKVLANDKLPKQISEYRERVCVCIPDTMNGRAFACISQLLERRFQQ